MCPRGKEGNYVLMGEVTLDLPTLKLPCKHAFKKFPMKYEQEDENQRSFAYYNDTGKIQYHPTGRPTCCKGRNPSTVFSNAATNRILYLTLHSHIYILSGHVRRGWWYVNWAE